MISNYKLKLSKYFLKQLKYINNKDKKLLEKKLKLIKENPFRFENLSGYRFLYKVKLNLKNNSQRLIYCIFKPEKNNIYIYGFFLRGKDYKNFKKIFSDELRNIKK